MVSGTALFHLNWLILEAVLIYRMSLLKVKVGCDIWLWHYILWYNFRPGCGDVCLLLTQLKSKLSLGLESYVTFSFLGFSEILKMRICAWPLTTLKNSSSKCALRKYIHVHRIIIIWFKIKVDLYPVNYIMEISLYIRVFILLILLHKTNASCRAKIFFHIYYLIS